VNMDAHRVWLVVLTLADRSEINDLMDVYQYFRFVTDDGINSVCC
jgi:hypothetical protein